MRVPNLGDLREKKNERLGAQRRPAKLLVAIGVVAGGSGGPRSLQGGDLQWWLALSTHVMACRVREVMF
ncbi:hypothetical protein DEO72_LG1g1702 [Vigna unguiculata]|uniref:Uncharacterized protein n=1 Tax=Vigna unguiculata TaxID=3917 RepID=A0A4D6KNJ0_VIGUN|nr:hypothetical protein DEO72_LG1g1702 [Vigna unguiculata]